MKLLLAVDFNVNIAIHKCERHDTSKYHGKQTTHSSLTDDFISVLLQKLRNNLFIDFGKRAVHEVTPLLIFASLGIHVM